VVEPSKRRRQRGSHVYPRTLPSGRVVFYAYVAGRKPPRVSLDTSDAADAERRFRALLARPAAELRGAAGAAPEMKLAEIATLYLEAPHGWTRQTHRTKRNRLDAVGAWLEGRGLQFASQISPTVLDVWLGERRQKRTHRTINRDLRDLKCMLAWAAERGLCNPCGAVASKAYFREAKRSRRFVVPDPAEMAAILAKLDALYKESEDRARERMRTHAGGRWPRAGARACVGAIYVTGLRIDELRRLDASDLHDGALWARPESGAAASAEPGKGYRERHIPLSPEAQAIVREFFATTKGKKRTFSESWLVRELHDATDALELPRCGLHDIRRGFATEAVRAGVDIVVVSRWLGHADIATTERYIAEYRSDRRVIAPLPRAFAPTAGREHNVSNTGVQAGPNPPDLSLGGSGGSAAFAAAITRETGSYPWDLNPRPAVYETAEHSHRYNEKQLRLHNVSTDLSPGEAFAALEGRIWRWHDLALAREVWS
jgi:integrase